MDKLNHLKNVLSTYIKIWDAKEFGMICFPIDDPKGVIYLFILMSHKVLKKVNSNW